MTVLAPSSTHPAPAHLSRDALRDLLLSKNFSALEEYYGGLHRTFAEGPLSEKELHRAYAVAESYRPEFTRPFRAWVNAHPQSYPARVSLASHLFAHGLKLRTMRRAKDIPEENRQELAEVMAEAWSYFVEAVELDPQATLAYCGLIHLQMQQGEQGWDEYLAGIQAAPQSMHLRHTMLSNLRTEWGGSHEAQQAFVKRPEHEALPEEDRTRLEARRLRQLGHYLSHFDGDQAGAKKAFRQSLALSREAHALTGLANWAGPFAKRRLLNEALALEPEDDHIRALHAIGRLETFAFAGPQLKILRDCAEWGEPFATDVLGAPMWVIRLRPILMRFIHR